MERVQVQLDGSIDIDGIPLPRQIVEELITSPDLQFEVERALLDQPIDFHLVAAGG